MSELFPEETNWFPLTTESEAKEIAESLYAVIVMRSHWLPEFYPTEKEALARAKTFLLEEEESAPVFVFQCSAVVTAKTVTKAKVHRVGKG